MISFREVTFRYGRELVIASGELEVGPGLTLVLGPNGSGKSTLLKLAAGVAKPERGSVLVDGLDLWRREVESRLHIAYVPEHPDVTPYASVEELLSLVASLRGVDRAAAGDAARRAGIEGYRRRSIRELSQGQRRRALLAAAWIGEPSLLVLDEPLEAMDRPMRREIEGWVARSVEEGRTVLLATHDYDGFVALASSVVSVVDGSIEKDDALPSEIEKRRRRLEGVAAGVGLDAAVGRPSASP